MMDKDYRTLVHIYLDICNIGCSTMFQVNAYHAEFPQEGLGEKGPICELEVLNAVVAVKK